jgi:hypothetical protein
MTHTALQPKWMLSEGLILSEGITGGFQSVTKSKNNTNLKIMLIFQFMQNLFVCFCGVPDSPVHIEYQNVHI